MIDYDVTAEILKLNVSVSQAGNRTALELLQRVLPGLKIREYTTGREHNGWVIPHNWVIDRALIKKDGKVIFDGQAHPMAVAGYSSPFTGTLSWEELEPHLFTKESFPDAYPYHCMNNYRPWAKHWGFCVPYNTYKSWGPGSYEVQLETRFLAGQMVLGECVQPGQSQETILFNAHTCHTCQANDGLIGVMVIMELFKWLQTQNTRYSYLGIVAPEHIGTVFYVADQPEEKLAQIKLGCFVEMVGSNTPLVLQQSFTGQTIIDQVSEYVLRQVQPELKVGGFRTIVGNDETVWEAPGVEVPMVSISRWPYPEYHTTEDNLKIISRPKVAESLEVFKRIVRIFEEDRTIVRKFKGLIALSNPKYNLYKERPDPTVHKNISEADLRLGHVQDVILRYFDGQMTVFQLARKFDLTFEGLMDYLKGFEAKGLIELRPVPSLDHYRAAPPPAAAPT